MKIGIAVTVLVCVVLCCLLSVCDGKPKEMYLYHPIDHFNYRADVSQTFQGRYFIEGHMHNYIHRCSTINSMKFLSKVEYGGCCDIVPDIRSIFPPTLL